MEIELGPISAADFIAELKLRYPALLLDHVMIAVNEQFVEPTSVIAANDTVALLPPVSGG
ncbi:MoaD/ThiS family protein [Paenibacillus sp. GM2]|nr:MoaD/ThiS family protein [Paenibacillus sp. GM2]